VAVAGTAVLLVILFLDRSRKQAECSGRGCASSDCSFCFYWQLLELCHVQSKAYAEERLMDFAAESGPASIQNGSLIHSQEHAAELDTSGNLKYQALVPFYAFSCFHNTRPVWRADGGL